MITRVLIIVKIVAITIISFHNNNFKNNSDGNNKNINNNNDNNNENNFKNYNNNNNTNGDFISHDRTHRSFESTKFPKNIHSRNHGVFPAKKELLRNIKSASYA